MQTNLNAEHYADLKARGQELIAAARAFWEVHRRIGGPRAVVWLEADDGSLVVFTRGEYRSQLLCNIGPLSEETPLSDPFVEDVPSLEAAFTVCPHCKGKGCIVDYGIDPYESRCDACSGTGKIA